MRVRDVRDTVAIVDCGRLGLRDVPHRRRVARHADIHVRATDVPRPRGELVRRGRGARQVLEHVAPVDRRACGSRARRAAPAPASARPAGRGSGRSASARRSRSTPAARPPPARRPSSASRPRAASRGGARAARPAAPARRGTRRGARRPPRRRGERAGRAPLALGERARGRALHRVDQVVRDVDAVQRLAPGRRRSSRRRARGRRARRPRRHALARAGEAARPVAVARRRGTSAAPT